MEIPAYFNDLKVDLNNANLFPVEIYEWTKGNPNPAVSYPCIPKNDSLDVYASQLTQEMLKSLKG